jgi:hypothetical protein
MDEDREIEGLHAQISVINRAKHPVVRWNKPAWEHPKCNPLLHIWKRGSREKDKCYCKRKTMKATMRAFMFIEAR